MLRQVFLSLNVFSFLIAALLRRRYLEKPTWLVWYPRKRSRLKSSDTASCSANECGLLSWLKSKLRRQPPARDGVPFVITRRLFRPARPRGRPRRRRVHRRPAGLSVLDSSLLMLCLLADMSGNCCSFAAMPHCPQRRQGRPRLRLALLACLPSPPLRHSWHRRRQKA